MIIGVTYTMCSDNNKHHVLKLHEHVLSYGIPWHKQVLFFAYLCMFLVSAVHNGRAADFGLFVSLGVE